MLGADHERGTDEERHPVLAALPQQRAVQPLENAPLAVLHLDHQLGSFRSLPSARSSSPRQLEQDIVVEHGYEESLNSSEASLRGHRARRPEASPNSAR